MARRVTTVIGFDGEAEYRAACQEIAANLKLIGSEMKLTTASYKDNAGSIEALTAKQNTLQKQYQEQVKAVEQNQKALDALKASGTASTSQIAAMETKLNDSKTALQNTENELKKTDGELQNVGKSAEDTGKKTSVFGDVLKATLTADAIKAGLKAIVDGIKAIGSAVSNYINEGSDMATSAAENQTKLTQVMRNTMSATDDQIQSIVELTKAQENLGVVSSSTQIAGAQELGTYLEKKESLEALIPVMNDMVAQQYGVNASQESAAGIATMLGKVMNGQVGALSRYGYTFTDAQAKILTFGDESERAAVLADVVSESVGGMNEALAQTDAGKMSSLNTVLDRTKTTVGAMANDFKAQIAGQMLPAISSLSDAFTGVLKGSGSVEDFSKAFKGVFKDAVNVINDFLPQFFELGIQIITGVVTGVTDNIDIIIEGLNSIIDAIIPAIIELLPMLMDAGAQLLMGVLNGIIQALPALANAAMQMVSILAAGFGKALPTLIPVVIQAVLGIVKAFTDNAPKLVDGALALIKGLVQGLISAIPVIVKALPEIINAIVNFLIESIPAIIDAGIQLLTALVENLPEIINAIVEALPDIIDAIISALITLTPLLIEAGIKLFIALVEALPTIISTILKAIPEIVTSVLNAFTERIPDIISMGKDLFESLIEKLPEILITIGRALDDIGNSIKDYFHNMVSAMVTAGGDLIRGLWQGIADVKQWILDKISGFTADIVNWVKLKFGISSPSRIFAAIGSFMAQGLGDGFTNEMDSVSKAIADSIPTDFDTPNVFTDNYNRSGYGGHDNIGMKTAQGQSGNTFILQVQMDKVDEVYKLKQIFENFSHNKIVYQGV